MPEDPQASGRRPPTIHAFFAHHKTGNTLSLHLCKVVASSAGKNCTFCRYLAEPPHKGARPRCVLHDHDPGLKQGFSSFMVFGRGLASSVRYLNEYTEDFRAVHMVRDPMQLALSDYAYDLHMNSAKWKSRKWDADVGEWDSSNLADRLKEVARAMRHIVEDAAAVCQATEGDSRFMSMDLETYRADRNGTMARLFGHLLKDPGQDAVATMLRQAQSFSRLRWGPTTGAKVGLDLANATVAWEQLFWARDPDVVRVMRYAAPLGYKTPAQPGAHG